MTGEGGESVYLGRHTLIMPPRRSLGRNVAATPARSTRASSAVPVTNSATRRVTRASSQQPEDGVANPNLPELQTVQSYAYGSSKIPGLPEQLVARDRMTLQDMADKIETGVEQAGQRVRGHVQEVQATVEVNGPAGRTRGRTSRDSSSEPSQAPETKAGKPAVEKEQRTAAWAESLEDDELEDIPEEEDSESEAQDDESRRDTDPSSFPEGLYERSYNYERGVRKSRPAPQPEDNAESFGRQSRRVVKRIMTSTRETLSHIMAATAQWFARIGRSIATAIRELPDSSIFSMTVKMLAATLLLGTISFLFCSVYTRTCDSGSTSLVALNLQKFCGTCTAPTSTYDLSQSDPQDFSKLSTTLAQINKQIADLERRLTSKIDSKHNAVESEMDSLRRQQAELTNDLANVQHHGSSSSDTIASPLMSQVNFFAPSNGAIINYQSSSPTRQRTESLPLRVLRSAFRIHKYTALPPITALEAWHDVGDCWCASDVAAGQDYIRLSVSTREMIYPTELILEHYPAAGSLDPTTAPKEVEVWADFSHLDSSIWKRLGLSSMQEGNVLGNDYALVGKGEYKVGRGAHHIQAFRLNVNQQGLFHHARSFTLRVKSSWGSEHVCLYRVRLHGVGMDAVEEVEG